MANIIYTWLGGNRRQIMMALGLTVILVAPRIVLELYPLPNPLPYDHYLDFDASRDGTHLTPLEGLALGAIIVGLLVAIWRIQYLSGQPSQQQTFNTQRLMGWFLFAILFLNVPLFLDTRVPPEQIKVSEDWQHVQLWVRDNTPRSVTFLTPPTLDGFRLTARRAHLSDWKDGTLLVFNSDLAVEWYERMLALGFDPETFSFTPLSQTQVCAVAARYTLDYALVFRVWGIEGESVFENDTFAVLPVNNLACSEVAKEGS
ncbi:MAG: hypothetical protein HC915_15925 [Anaerolineae bacterium]|nr:hypothetical protein [Anaerolineae bacterium]